MRNKRALGWFLFGLGGQLQLFGTSLCFTEVFVYGAAIVLILGELPKLRRNGIMPFFWLSIALVVNALISCFYNKSPVGITLRGMAVVCLIPCAIVVSHWMLRKDMVNFKWSIVGSAISSLLSTFFFQKAVEVTSMAGGVRDSQTAEAIIHGPLWMVSQVGNLLTVVPKGWYLSCPTWFSAGMPVILAAFALFTSVSGRGTSIRALCAAMFVLIGGKRSSQIKRKVCNGFWLLCILGALVVFGFKMFYQTAASGGWLGEAARQKYENQTRGDTSIGQLLMGGRGESFIGLLAAVDRPFVGWGPWARDTGGYRLEFLTRYGDPEDVARIMLAESRADTVGLIPCHAYLTEFWCWFGICGLLLWLYVMFVLIRYLRQDCYAVPQWYMWLAASVPAYFWNIFFNPFSARVGSVMFVVAALMVRAVRRGVQELPTEMALEIQRCERVRK